MEPIGTITKYYPFIDEDSKSLIDTLMKESGNYHDFVCRLAEAVLENETTDNLVYIAAAQLWYICERDLSTALVEKYNRLASIKPWIFYWGTQDSGYAVTRQAIMKSLEPLLTPPKEDWIVVELLLAHAFSLSGQPEAINLLTTAKTILDRQLNLTCFTPLAYLAEGAINSTEGKVSDAMIYFRRGLAHATADDDAVYQFFSALNLAIFSRNIHPQQSLDSFEQVYQIAQALRVPVFIAETLHSAAITYETLGEYDLAISSELECLSEFSAFGNEIPYASLSRFTAALGDGQRALEWADRSLDDKEFYGGYLGKAHALIILNRLEEAEKFLDVADRKILRVGSDAFLGRYYFVSGLLEMAKGEFTSAIATLEQAYEILYPMERSAAINDTLIALAKAELDLFMQSKIRDQSLPGKWLSILENRASTFDMHGIAMQAALLRAEVFKSQGQLQDANETLRRALELSDSPGVKTLRKRIKIQIQEIDWLMHDEELAS